jgi:hypothetical protein
MAKYGSASLTCTLDDSAGTPRIVTGFVLTMGALEITNQTQKSTAFGDTWEKALVTGIQSGTPIALGGILDDTALTGTFATMIPTAADAVPGFTRTLTIALGGGHTYVAEVILTKGAVVPKPNNLHDYSASLQPTGTIAIT